MAKANKDWQAQAALEGGPIFEFATHLFDLAVWFNGPVHRHSFSARRLYRSCCNVSAVGYLEHASGARSVVVYEEVAGCSSERVTMHGPAITAEVSGGMFAPNRLYVDDRGRAEVFAGPDDRLECGGFLQMSQHVVGCVAHGRPVAHNPADAVEAVRLALAFDALAE